MGTNNPNFPDSVRCDEEAIQYLGLMVQALKTNTYFAKTGAGPFTLLATEEVGGVIQFSGVAGGAITVNSATAAALIAQMQALDANAGVGSTAQFTLINDNTSTSTLTLATATGVTLVGTVLVAIATSRRYQIKILTLTTVSITDIT